MKSHIRNNYPKVLIAIPTYEGKNYIFPKCYEAVKAFTYPNYELIVIDNSPTVDYYLKAKRAGYKEFIHVPRGGNSRQALCNAQNYARQKAIDEGFDYLLFVESDLIPPRDSVENLIKWAKPVVGSLYFIGTHGVQVPCLFIKEYKEDVLAMGTRLLRKEEIPDYINKGLKPIHGTGLGCTLIRIDVVKKYRFWYDERFDNKHSDVYWYMDLDNNGVPVFVDTDRIIPHYPSSWDLVKDR
jgi:glycosyltransferase involved in cell wall biosynthesis